MRFRAAVVAIAVLLFHAGLRAQELALANRLGVDRAPEVIEVPLTEIFGRLHITAEQQNALVAENGATGARIASQIYGDDPASPPDRLLLLVQLKAREKLTVRFRIDAAAPKVEPLVFGRDAPERKDDFAWENQLVAYRVYGPALEATGEIASGIDVWSKRVPNFVIDSFYKRDAEGARTHNPALSYHKDNGQGLDSYYVGPTRGCGGTAVFAQGKLYTSKNYTVLRKVADGPIRFAFEMSYAPWDAGGTKVTETKRIVLDAGTHMNKVTSTYSFLGPSELDLVAGIAVHAGAKASLPVAGKIALVWDTPQDATAGRIATGLIVAPGQIAETMEAADHALVRFTRRSGEPFVYYAGAGWSKADMPAAVDWENYLKLRLAMLQSPVRSRWVQIGR